MRLVLQRLEQGGTVAVLLTSDLLEARVPVSLLPPAACAGSIVDVTVTLAPEAERDARASLLALQDHLITSFVDPAPRRLPTQAGPPKPGNTSDDA